MTKTRDLADLGGGFIQAGTGAVQRTVESKLQDVVSVKDFGAVGDGVADDTAAIQAAIAACQTASKTSLFFPTGIYRIQSTINLNGEGIATNPGANKAGGVLQVVTATYNTQTALDITYTDLVAATITPTSETSKILVIVNVNGLAVLSAARTIQANICRGSTQLVEFEKEAGYSGAVTTELAVGGAGATWLDSPQADTALTYKMQVKANATPGAFVCASGSLASITLMELAA